MGNAVSTGPPPKWKWEYGPDGRMVHVPVRAKGSAAAAPRPLFRKVSSRNRNYSLWSNDPPTRRSKSRR